MLHSDRFHIHVGLEKPVRILQFTDVHLSLADEVDGDDMKQHAASRRNVFFREGEYPERDPVGFLQDALEYAKQFDCTVITGDVLDFTSHANCETAKRLLAGHDYLFCAGNHEFCPKVGIPDSFDRMHEIYGDIQGNFRGSMYFESRIVGGLNLIAIDNSYYVWTEEQFALLRKEVERGYPILIFCHVPMTCNQLDHNPPHKDLHASEEEVAVTRAMTKYIVEEPMIKGIFAGHWHKTMSPELPNGKPHHVIGGLFRGVVGEITVD